MNYKKNNSASFFGRYWKFIAISGIFLCLSLASYAQNAKGDKPVNNRQKVREARFKSRSKQGDHARTKDIAGRRIRHKNKSSAGSASAARHSKPIGKISRSSSKHRDRVGRPIAPIQVSRPKNNQRAVSNRDQLARLRRMQSDPSGSGKGKQRVVPRSASRAYIAHKSINPIARFKRKRKTGEQAHTRDISGRRLTKVNFQSRRPPIQKPSLNPSYSRRKNGDRPYKGRAGGDHISATRTKPRAWKGDITGRPIRAQQKKQQNGDRPRFKGSGGGYRTATQSGEKRGAKPALPPKAPGMGANGISKFSGNIKGKKQQKGGGSRSGKLWNNDQTPIPTRPASGETQRAGRFQGNLKSKRPEKGGGSVSGKLWNNDQAPIPVRPASGNVQRAGRFQGNLKAKRPEKGGGSVSGKLWNNDQTPIPVRPPSGNAQRAGKFQGNLKASRPQKGGGSVSGKLWNNKEAPIPVRPPSGNAQRAASHRGNKTMFQIKPMMRDQGEEYPGDLRLFEARPSMRDQGEEYTGDVKLKRFGRSYVRNKNSSEEALKKARPDKSTFEVDKLQYKVRQYNYVSNKSSDKEALKVREPGKAFVKATDYQGNIKMKKFDLFAKNKKNLHPDAQFVKINKNNVAEEKDFLTNFKLWWARLFKKNDTVPDHLKDNDHKPRYDKGEQGLWYD